MILENCVFFIVVEMILLTFFDTPNQKSLIWRFQFAVPEHIAHPVESIEPLKSIESKKSIESIHSIESKC